MNAPLIAAEPALAVEGAAAGTRATNPGFEPGALETRSTWAKLGAPWWALPLAAALVAATLVRDGADANGIAFAAVQLVLVTLAVVDLATRRLPNVITLPTALAGIGIRAVFEPARLGDAALAGAAALGVFAVMFVVMRGGFGMGDVKLAAMLGFVLGAAVVPALIVGTIAGGLSSVALVATRRVSRRSKIAYGPYLALGGAVAILAFQVPALV